jgi:hypothetical protein
MKDGGTILVEGAVIEDLVEPLALFSYKRRRVDDDQSNWWIPTIACLREWVESSFFDIVYEIKGDGMVHSSDYPGTITRYTVVARAVRRADPNYVFLDDELRSFDLNEYSLWGYLDVCRLESTGEIYLQGWAVDFGTGGHVEEIQIVVDGRVLQRCVPSMELPAVAAAFDEPDALLSGWCCRIEPNNVAPNSTVMVKAINNRKRERTLVVGTLDEILMRP